MNKTLLAALFGLTIMPTTFCVHAAGNSEEKSGQDLLSPLSAGMSWRVELLPNNQRSMTLDWQYRRSPSQDISSSSLTSDRTHPQLIEENFIVGTFRKQILHPENDRKIVRYAVGNVLVYEQPPNGEYSVEPSDEASYGGPMSARRLREFGWLRPGYRVGTMVVDGIKCEIYQAAWPLPAGSEGSSQKSTLTISEKPNTGPKISAAISIESRLPVRLEDPTQIRRYLFESSQPSPELPAGVLEAIRKQQEAIRREIQRYNIPQ